MRLFAAAFLAGTAALQQAAGLPDARLAGLALAAALAAGLCPRGAARATLLVAAGFLAGVGLAAWRAEVRLADGLPAAWEGRDIVVEGVVAGLPREDGRGTRFAFEVGRVVTQGAQVPRRLSLAAYGPPQGEALRVRAGERWRVAVRLKRPRGLRNPHGFDFERWALARDIRATGYLRDRPAPLRLAAHEAGWPWSVHRLRGAIRERLQEGLRGKPYSGVLVALAIGDQDAIPARDWAIFWRTGVGHLVSISGLHVTMLASLAGLVAAFAWRRVPCLVARVPARTGAVVAGLAVAAAYTLLAGYGVPAQRTLAMLVTAGAFSLARRATSPSRVLAAALVAVLAIDPWAVGEPGFWLSFGAVAAILFAVALRPDRPGKFASAVATQAAVTLALWPLLAAWFGEFPLVSPLANAFAIPVVSLAVVPLTLAGVVVPALLAPAHALFAATMVPLGWLAAWPDAVAELPAAPLEATAAAIAGVALLLAPRGMPLRVAGAVLLLPLLLARAPAPPRGEAWLDVLDVGQGLAVVVRTATHALAYDAGPAWGAESDAGQRVVVPHLRAEGVRRLDGLVVSHADDDHAGGAASVAASRRPRWVLASLPAAQARASGVAGATGCRAGQRWEWDGVAFEVLHPPVPSHGDNDGSCVLRVATAAGSMLLAGDIEGAAEAALVASHGARLRATVLLVPHHGSRTSSTPGFLAAVSPARAVISAGWRNRFRQPAGEVLSRYGRLGIPVRRTDLEGALRVRLPAGEGQRVEVLAVATRPRYWREDRVLTPRPPVRGEGPG